MVIIIIMGIWLFQPNMLYAILYDIVIKLVVTRSEYFIVPNPYYNIIYDNNAAILYYYIVFKENICFDRSN